jgi:hypothetical protein
MQMVVIVAMYRSSSIFQHISRRFIELVLRGRFVGEGGWGKYFWIVSTVLAQGFLFTQFSRWDWM